MLRLAFSVLHLLVTIYFFHSLHASRSFCFIYVLPALFLPPLPFSPEFIREVCDCISILHFLLGVHFRPFLSAVFLRYVGYPVLVEFRIQFLTFNIPSPMTLRSVKSIMLFRTGEKRATLPSIRSASCRFSTLSYVHISDEVHYA